MKLWEGVDCSGDAVRVMNRVSWICFLLAGVVGGVTLYAKLPADRWIDFGILAVLGVGLRLRSRLAALGVFLYLSAMFYQTAQKDGMLQAALLVIFLSPALNALWASFKYPGLRKKEEGTGAAEESPKRSKLPWVLGGIVVLAVLAAGVYWFASKPNSPGMSLAGQIAGAAAPGTSGETRTFRMKNGSVITGKVLSEDDDYYVVASGSGRQDIVIKQDIKNQ